MISVSQKQELLAKPVWSYKDIMAYCDVSKTTAISIKKRAIKEKNGGVSYGTNYVLADSVLALYGTSRSNESLVIRDLLINEEMKGEKYARS